jgi:hypothetical protein
MKKKTDLIWQKEKRPERSAFLLGTIDLTSTV